MRCKRSQAGRAAACRRPALVSFVAAVFMVCFGAPVGGGVPQTHNHPTLRRAGGGIKPGQRVNVSFDMLGGMVGEIGDGAHVNSFADPDYYTGMESVVKWVLDRLGGCCMLAWIVTFGTCCRPGFWFAGATPPGGR